MESEIKPRIASARRLVAEIARVGGLEPPARCQGETSARVLPISSPEDLGGEVVKVVVADDRAKNNLLSGLHETKTMLLELASIQLEDLLEATPSGSASDVEDVEKMLFDMAAVYRSMKTIAAIEAASIET